MKRTPLKRKTGLRRTVLLPRSPMKRRPAATKSAAEKRHMARVAALPCIICGKPGPSTVHHVRRKVTRSGTFARDHKRVAPLCASHHFHDHSEESVERIAESGVFERWGIDLWKEAERLWEESCAGA